MLVGTPERCVGVDACRLANPGLRIGANDVQRQGPCHTDLATAGARDHGGHGFFIGVRVHDERFARLDLGEVAN